ncbi:hypothetical protein I8748_23420 [Nostoc sp. CENA67]|uniref:Uncharacterized protein n=1 Tax=Amazonocrinis nigriterrae CENA67 TaxID=2794033 RepID=A0A8J7HXD6_9NOST|nr:hypothetical protein [Amazonocrinis nigriterrae]MBH8565097.1 hypothetical protein [Amazonocrinis nigriterrae CENA67]
MAHKVLSVKVDPDDWEWFKVLAKDFDTQAEAFKALRQVYQGVNPTNTLLSGKVYQSVCVGEILPHQWELKPALEETIKRRRWYVFSDDQVVAVKQKTANGSKSWLEVAVVYPDKVWDEAKTDSRFQYKPVTTLLEYQEKMEHPAIAEAVAKGWQPEWWGEMLKNLVREAEDYLQVVNQSEALQIKEVYQGVCTTEDKPLVLTLTMDTLADRLAPRHLSLSTVKTDKGRANILRDLPATLAKIRVGNIAEWTTERDPDGLTWQPTDETRETWVVVQP